MRVLILMLALLLMASCSPAPVEPVETTSGQPTAAVTTTGGQPTESSLEEVGGSQDKPTVWVESVTAKAGDTVEVKAHIENNPGIMAFVFGFEYDTSRLELLNAETIPAFGDDSEYIRKLVWLGDEDSTYNGEFILLTFKVLEDAKPGDSAVHIVCGEGDVCNYDEEDVYFTFVDGTVTVVS